MERDKKWLGCQAVTPGTTTPLVKTTNMPTNPWSYLAVDLMGPLPTIKSLLVTSAIIIGDGLRWMLFQAQSAVESSSI